MIPPGGYQAINFQFAGVALALAIILVLAIQNANNIEDLRQLKAEVAEYEQRVNELSDIEERLAKIEKQLGK